MTTIHLTDAQRDTFTACGLVVVEAADADQWSGGVALTATCPDCAGSGWVAPFEEACDCDDGVVTLGRFTIPALLQVWLNSEERDHQVPHACVGDHGLMIVSEGGYMLPVPLDPLPLPGQWVVRPEPVTP